MSGYLLVQSGGSPYGLPLSHVLEVIDEADLVPLPVMRGAVRGVTTCRKTLVSVVHMHALLRDSEAPREFSGTVVLAKCLGRHVAWEVDDAIAVIRDEPLPVPPGRHVPWAVGMAERDDLLVPILNLELAGERLALAVGQGS